MAEWCWLAFKTFTVKTYGLRELAKFILFSIVLSGAPQHSSYIFSLLHFQLQNDKNLRWTHFSNSCDLFNWMWNPIWDKELYSVLLSLRNVAVRICPLHHRSLPSRLRKYPRAGMVNWSVRHDWFPDGKTFWMIWPWSFLEVTARHTL